MKNNLPDIDIDFFDRDKALALIKHIPAGIIKNGKLRRHNTGVYVQDIPFDPMENCATIDYKDAEDRGYFKIDFLNNSVYDNVKSESHLDKLMAMEPRWELLEHKEFVEKLPHISNYFNIVKKIKPQSIYDLAVIIALIRPGKKHLLIKSREEIEEKIWVRPEEGYYFKKSHSIAFAASIAVVMNLISEDV